MATVFDQEFSPFQLTQAQFRVSLAILNHGEKAGLTPGELSDYLFIERGAVTGLTTRMVEAGLLVRQPGENRRSYQLLLTDLGKEVVAKALPHAIELADETLGHLPSEQLDSIEMVLDEIESILRINKTVHKHAGKTSEQ